MMRIFDPWTLIPWKILLNPIPRVVIPDRRSLIPDPGPFQAFDLLTTLQYYNGWVFTVFCGPFTWLTPLRDSFAILPHEYAWACRSNCYSSPVRYTRSSFSTLDMSGQLLRQLKTCREQEAIWKVNRFETIKGVVWSYLPVNLLWNL